MGWDEDGEYIVGKEQIHDKAHALDLNAIFAPISKIF